MTNLYLVVVVDTTKMQQGVMRMERVVYNTRSPSHSHQAQSKVAKHLPPHTQLSLLYIYPPLTTQWLPLLQ